MTLQKLLFTQSCSWWQKLWNMFPNVIFFFIFQEPECTLLQSGSATAGITESQLLFGAWASFCMTWSAGTFPSSKTNRSVTPTSSSEQDWPTNAKILFAGAWDYDRPTESPLKRSSSTPGCLPTLKTWQQLQHQLLHQLPHQQLHLLFHHPHPQSHPCPHLHLCQCHRQIRLCRHQIRQCRPKTIAAAAHLQVLFRHHQQRQQQLHHFTCTLTNCLNNNNNNRYSWMLAKFFCRLQWVSHYSTDLHPTVCRVYDRQKQFQVNKKTPNNNKGISDSNKWWNVVFESSESEPVPRRISIWRTFGQPIRMQLRKSGCYGFESHPTAKDAKELTDLSPNC